MGRGKVTPEMAAEMKDLRNQGWSMYRIAGKFGVDSGTVRNHTDPRVAEFSPRSKKPLFTGHYPKEVKDKARRLYEEGMPYYKIAIIVGCNPTTVRRWCNPEIGEQDREQKRNRREDPEKREEINAYVADHNRHRYEVDDVMREKKRVRNKERRAYLKPGEFEKLWEKSGGICGLCVRPLPKDYKNGKLVHIDHKIPPDKPGGSHESDNLWLVHAECNLHKGDKLMEELNLPLTVPLQPTESSLMVQSPTNQSMG